MDCAHSKDGQLIPLNTTEPALVADGTHSITSTKTDITLNSSCTNFTIKPATIPTTPIFIKYWFGSTATATTTSFDIVLTECEPTIHLQLKDSCTHLSIIAASGTQAIYVKQYAG